MTTREDAKRLLPVLQAFAEGKAIQSRCIKGDKSLWYDDDDFSFDDDLEYRIKPSPTYRPFKDAKERVQEMLKHQPFGWIKSKKNGTMKAILAMDGDSVFTLNCGNADDSKALLNDCEFFDGEPFGIKEEE